MLKKKLKVSNFCVKNVNRAEALMATSIGINADHIAHYNGQRAAWLSLYKFIQAFEPDNDEIETAELLKFAHASFKKAHDVAYDENFEINFPREKQLALGKILAYKNFRTQIELWEEEFRKDNSFDEEDD